MGVERLPAPKRSPLCHDAGPLWQTRARGCDVSWANLACVHRHTPHQTSIHTFGEFLVNFGENLEIPTLEFNQTNAERSLHPVLYLVVIGIDIDIDSRQSIDK